MAPHANFSPPGCHTLLFSLSEVSRTLRCPLHDPAQASARWGFAPSSHPRGLSTPLGSLPQFTGSPLETKGLLRQGPRLHHLLHLGGAYPVFGGQMHEPGYLDSCVIVTEAGSGKDWVWCHTPLEGRTLPSSDQVRSLRQPPFITSSLVLSLLHSLFLPGLKKAARDHYLFRGVREGTFVLKLAAEPFCSVQIFKFLSRQ